MLRLRVDVLDRAGEPLILTVSFLKKIEVNPTLLLSIHIHIYDINPMNNNMNMNNNNASPRTPTTQPIPRSEQPPPCIRPGRHQQRPGLVGNNGVRRSLVLTDPMEPNTPPRKDRASRAAVDDTM